MSLQNSGTQHEVGYNLLYLTSQRLPDCLNSFDETWLDPY